MLLVFCRRRADLRRESVSHAVTERNDDPSCPAHTAPIEAPLTPEQALLTDQIGNEVYASHYAERKTYPFRHRLWRRSCSVGSMWTELLPGAPSHRESLHPNRRDGPGSGDPYTDLNYSPREGEVRTYLTDWANYRYTINRDIDREEVSAELLLPFTDTRLSAHGRGQPEPSCLAGTWRADRSRAMWKSGTSPSRPCRRRLVQGARVARGTALLTLDKLYSARNSREPRTEHWLLTVTYYLNPKQVSDQAKIFPQFETSIRSA